MDRGMVDENRDSTERFYESELPAPLVPRRGVILLSRLLGPAP